MKESGCKNARSMSSTMKNQMLAFFIIKLEC